MTHIATAADWADFLALHPQVESVDLLFTPMSGVPRGKRLRAHEMDAVYRSGRFLPGSLLVTDITGLDVVETGLVWADGDADRVVRPVPGSLVLQPWRGPKAAQILTSMYELDGTPNDLDPRHILQAVLDRFAADGLTPVVACELEFYLLDPARTADGKVQVPKLGAGQQRPMHTQVYGLRELDEISGFLTELLHNGDVQGVPIEGAISEFAPGQYEIGLVHRSNALRACDEAIMFKQLVKAVAEKHALTASFMAKPFAEVAGCGLHIHVSIDDAAGNNIFAHEDAAGTPALRHAIGGMKAHMAESLAIFAPNANSYRRFKANSYAPVAPTWGINNRTVSLRIPAGSAASRHVEHRICGADANPYLAVAAVLAAAHHGMTHKVDPGTMVTGDGYAHAARLLKDHPAKDHQERLALHWAGSLDRFAASTMLPDYLGARFCQMYQIVKRVELERFEATVSAQDFDWYLHSA
jgi:glutamine synthetase